MSNTISIKNVPVSEIMTDNVIAVEVTAGIRYTEQLFRQKKIRHLPVVKNGELTGIISLTDLQRLSFADNFGGETDVDSAIYNMLTLEQIMMNKPVTVQVTQSVKDVAEILSTHEFHALPVLDEAQLVGIVTTTDLIKYLLEAL